MTAPHDVARVRQIILDVLAGVPTAPVTWQPATATWVDSEESLRERILARVVTTPTGCWEWQGSRTRAGYGTISARGIEGVRHTAYVHRLAYRLFVGPIPEGMHVCHKCDNPPCCNPEHLFVGTAADNMHDRDSKGRDRHSRARQAVAK